MEFLDLTFFNNTLRLWLLALIAVVGTAVLVQLSKRLLLRRFRNLARRTNTNLDDMIILLVEKINNVVINFLSVYIGILVLIVPATTMQWISAIAFSIFLIQVGIWGDALVYFWLVRRQREQLEEHAGRATTLNAVSFVVRLLLFAILILLALDNMPGVEVTALLTGLGIGGVAVALAVQNILGDLFASLSIALDKPFVIGDFIVVGDYKGTVKQVGLKTTRVRSLWGEELIFANSDLLESRIRNYKDMQERRVSFKIGVAADTTPAQLRQIPQMIADVIQSLEQTRFDRAHFSNLGEYSLDFEIVYYVLSPDYSIYMDIQQKINLTLLEQFAAAGIEFPFPTQALYVAGIPNGSAVRTKRMPVGNGHTEGS